MATATSITYTTSNCGDIGSTSSTTFTSTNAGHGMHRQQLEQWPTMYPFDFFVGMEECRRGLTVDLDVALGKKPRFKPWQLTGLLGVLS